jgi:hypothetical protein
MLKSANGCPCGFTTVAHRLKPVESEQDDFWPRNQTLAPYDAFFGWNFKAAALAATILPEHEWESCL